jgi:hypothetical protein
MTGLSNVFASHKVYLIHGFAGLGIKMEKLRHSLSKAGYDSEIINYPSLTEDIDTVAKNIYQKILTDRVDSVSFITHSMGGLIARSVYKYLLPQQRTPIIYRMIMLAPPNKGTPVADFFVQSKIFCHLAGPNIKNLTTDSVSGASRYPIPSCDVGIILGVSPFSSGFNIFLEENNDGIVIPSHAMMGVEKDIAFVETTHTLIQSNKKVIKMTLKFLKTGKFE